MVISIDHGNRQVKTVHKAFVSGLMESSVRPALGEEYILYNNRYFSLTEHRLAYRRDKSKDESFFLLSTTIYLWLISLTASKELSILLLKLLECR